MIALKSKVKKSLKKKISNFRIQIRSRHPSHQWLRKNMGLLPFRSIVRLGSTTKLGDEVSFGGKRVECNTIEAVKTSSSKLLMKRAFKANNIKTADWWETSTLPAKKEYPLIIKPFYGSRGEGITLVKNDTEFNNWSKGKNLSNYIYERYYSFSREYRLHVTKDGCFYTCRKMLKSDTPKDKRHIRNDSTCVWILENNPQFDKPKNWDNIVQESIKALKAVGLDVGAIDLRVQSAKTEKGTIRDNPDFIIIETNSAPSFGNITRQKYLEEIPKILKSKYQSMYQLW
jgi:glutathione synthase/RimK-type ligase-like ATP-grasp enzyme